MIKTIGVAGLGLLGRGITACLLGHEYSVVTFDANEEVRSPARETIGSYVAELVEHGVCDRSVGDGWRERFVEAGSVEELAQCDFVIESITENEDSKRAFYAQLEAVLPSSTPIASNTSAIPITFIQNMARHPARFIGMHWGEPAHIMVFTEITRGPHTDDATFETALQLARSLGKDPTLVKKDIRGFVGNRIYYAALREMFFLLESGVADIEEIDRSWRTSLSWWGLYTGPFRNMDLTGIAAHATVMKDLFPELCNATEVPQTIQKIVDEGRAHAGTPHGFYEYTPEQKARWEENWNPFTWDIRQVAQKYAHMHEDADKTG